MNQFPPSTEYTITAISNFFENSRRCSWLKVHHPRWHRWQIEKIFNQKNFNYLFWTPLGSRINIYINFCLQVHFKESAAWYFHILPPVLLTPAANLPLVSLTLVAILAPVSTTLAKLVAKFAASVVDTGGKFATSVVDKGGAPRPANISANFWKNLKRSYRDTLGLGGNWPMKKTRSKKSCDTVPLNMNVILQLLAHWNIHS